MCAHFGWTWEYLHKGIAWALVQRMLIDARSYDSDSKDKAKEVKLGKKNKQAVANAINAMI